jgi:hypothetical protein
VSPDQLRGQVNSNSVDNLNVAVSQLLTAGELEVTGRHAVVLAGSGLEDRASVCQTVCGAVEKQQSCLSG